MNILLNSLLCTLNDDGDTISCWVFAIIYVRGIKAI